MITQAKLSKNILNSFLTHEIRLERSIRDRDFIFDCIHLLYYKCHKINPKGGGSYIDCPYWIRNKKSTIYPSNKK